jgi:hypothetical protein
MVPLIQLFVSILAASGTPHGSQGSAPSGIPFGLFQETGRTVSEPYTSGMQQAQPETILRDLAAAQARGARMVVNFAGGGARYRDERGHMDFDMWRGQVDRFQPIAGELSQYVADGTLYAAFLIDEPHSKERWGGETVPMATLDRMAQYMKTMLPDLPTAVRATPSQLRGYRWQYLDAAWAQYTARKGGIEDYVADETAIARQEGLGLVVGLNISKGGDGSSGFGSQKEPSMSGAEILRYGHALLGATSACAFISWDNRPAVVNRPDVVAAMRELAQSARSHPPTSCRSSRVAATG